MKELACVLLNHSGQVRITGVSLRKADPVGEIRHELRDGVRVSVEGHSLIMHYLYLHVRKLLHETASNPRRVKEPLTVSLMVHVEVLLLLPGQNFSEELLCHVLSEVVLHSVAVDKSRTELLGCHNLRTS